MVKLWEKGYSLDKSVEDFTVGEDYKIDVNLINADVLGSIAHAKMLTKIGILNSSELSGIKKVLAEIYNNPDFKISKEDEDVHTAIENYLVSKLGVSGKKIHTARSRNDQILTDLRIYTKENFLMLFEEVLELVETLHAFAKKNEFIPMPGYTHTRKAMPSSIGLWAGAFLESLIDDIKLLKTAYSLNNQCPLGSAAGYGVSLNIDREMTSELLGFESLQNNTLYVQNSRGKIESIVIFSLFQIIMDIGKISNDLIYFSAEEFGFFALPEKVCTGSSIMPQKKNPDALELIRGYVSVIEVNLIEVIGISKNLFSGYNRDLQLTKEPLIKTIGLSHSIINIISLIFKELEVDKEKCISACTRDIYATDSALRLVNTGMPFREAYKEISKNLDKIKADNPVENIKSKKHHGATGNLGMEKVKKHLESVKIWLAEESNKYKTKRKLLLK